MENPSAFTTATATTVSMPAMPKTAAMTPLPAPTKNSRQLKTLNSGDNMIVFHHSTGSEIGQIMIERFPESVASYFSGVIKAALVETDRKKALLTKSEREQPQNQLSKVSVDFGSIADNKEVFTWMLACCQGSAGVQTNVEDGDMSHYLDLLAIAKELDIPILVKKLNSRIISRLHPQVSFEDLEIIYDRLPASDQIHLCAARSIAYNIEKRAQGNNGWVKDSDALKRYAAENEEYNHDVQEELAKIRSPRHEREQLEREARRTNNEFHHNRRQAYPALQSAGSAPREVHFQIQAPEIRRSNTGRPYHDITAHMIGSGPSYATNNPVVTPARAEETSTASYAQVAAPKAESAFTTHAPSEFGSADGKTKTVSVKRKAVPLPYRVISLTNEGLNQRLPIPVTNWADEVQAEAEVEAKAPSKTKNEHNEVLEPVVATLNTEKKTHEPEGHAPVITRKKKLKKFD